MPDKTPPFRKLRGYAFDPSLSLKIDTASINEIVYKIAWEEVKPGPTGEYIEIIDYDPTVQQFYKPVDLNDTYILAQDGLEPDESNPQFHQQMVYAVVMTTIKNFEKALGRKILWAPQRVSTKEFEKYVGRLRVYPHALREANAFYSPLKKSLLFGYFSATPANETLQMPGSLVFTALSHDIIAHETTHAILDGMHNNYNNATNPDVLAFHEAFADIVALFQHFTFPEVLRHQIARTRGDLTSQNLLGQLAQQFGSAIGSYGSLRDAIGSVDEATGKWVPQIPDAAAYRTLTEPHELGSILVSAVFEAFTTIYKTWVADLMRIASNGTGILQAGELHPDLVNRLAAEAAKAAGHVLNMCIRALDYCPPVDITFGDYLRAIITADSDVVKDDNRNYRLAFIDAFRRRGIYPEGIKTLSEESLRYADLNMGYAIDKQNRTIEPDVSNNYGHNMDADSIDLIGIINGYLRDYGNVIKYVKKREDIFAITKDFIKGRYDEETGKIYVYGLHARIKNESNDLPAFSRITGLTFLRDYLSYSELGIRPTSRKFMNYHGPAFQIQNLHLVSRVGPDNTQINQVVFSIIQRSFVKMENGEFVFYKFRYPPLGKKEPSEKPPPEYFGFTGGCTLIFDLDDLKLRYAISKPILDIKAIAAAEKQGVREKPVINVERLKKQYDYQQSAVEGNEFAAYFSPGQQQVMEPFAFLHQH